MGELKKEHILEYIDERLAAGYAASGINTDLRCLRSFLRFLQEEGYPVDGSLLRIPGLKQPNTLPRYLTEGQMRSLCHALPREDLLLCSAFHLLWQGGLRLGDVEELRLSDLDLPSRMLIVRNGKGLKDRVVYLSNAAANALEDYLSVREVSEDDHVFLYRGAALRKDWLGARLRALGRRAGVKLHAHALRHTCATQLLNAGCRITSIQKVLGHKRLDTTMIYARIHDLTVAEDYFRVTDRLWCIKE